MAAIKLQQFGGQLPAWDDTLLPDGQASESVNGYLFSGALIGWRMPRFLRNLNDPTAGFAYRVPVITKGFANNVLTFTSIPLAGDKVKIGELTYRFVSALVDPFDVLIGADVNAAASNLFDALTMVSANLGVTYANGTYKNPVIDNTTPTTENVLTPGATPTIYIQAPDPGNAFNGTVSSVVVGTARMSFATTSFAGGVNASFDSNLAGGSVWLEFSDPDTKVMRSPVVDDKFNRYYISSPTKPPKYNTYDRIVAGSDAFLLGLDPPGTGPAVDVTGGGNQELLGLPTSTSSNTALPNTNTIWVMPVTATAAMSLLNLEIVPASPSTTAQFAAVLYADNGGVPGALLNTGAIVTGCVTGVPILSAFANPTGLAPDTQYWIGFMTDSGVSFQLADDLGTAGVRMQTNTWTNGPPGIFSGTTPLGDIQMWGNAQTSSVLETRGYTYTWLTEYNEEGPPADPTLVNGWSNGIWNVQLGLPPTDDMGVLRNITAARIYRTVSGVGGSTVFFWVADINIASNAVTLTDAVGEDDGTVTATASMKVADTLSSAVVSANFQMPSTNWFGPPEGVHGIVAMPNGMSVGFRDNEVWFSEPYRPHAWPPGYVLTTEFPVKGLGVVGLSVIICTDGTPYIASGANPADMSMLKLPEAAPCISGGSIVATSDGVYYASPKGLISVVPAGQAINTTEMWITRDKWTQITPQKNLRAVLQQSCYYAVGTVNGSDVSEAQRGYTIELSTLDSSSFTIWPQPGGHRIGFNKLTAPNSVDIVNAFNDPWTGATMFIQGGQLFYHDFTETSPIIQPFTWTSKSYQQKHKTNMAALRVFYDIPASTPTQNPTRETADKDDPVWNTLQTGQHGIIFIYGDDELITVRELRSSGELLRINSGRKCEFWRIKVAARVSINNIQMATSVKELRSV